MNINTWPFRFARVWIRGIQVSEGKKTTPLGDHEMFWWQTRLAIQNVLLFQLSETFTNSNGLRPKLFRLVRFHCKSKAMAYSAHISQGWIQRGGGGGGVTVMRGHDKGEGAGSFFSMV